MSILYSISLAIHPVGLAREQGIHDPSRPLQCNRRLPLQGDVLQLLCRKDRYAGAHPVSFRPRTSRYTLGPYNRHELEVATQYEEHGASENLREESGFVLVQTSKALAAIEEASPGRRRNGRGPVRPNPCSRRDVPSPWTISRLQVLNVEPVLSFHHRSSHD